MNRFILTFYLVLGFIGYSQSDYYVAAHEIANHVYRGGTYKMNQEFSLPKDSEDFKNTREFQKIIEFLFWRGRFYYKNEPGEDTIIVDFNDHPELLDRNSWRVPEKCNEKDLPFWNPLMIPNVNLKSKKEIDELEKRNKVTKVFCLLYNGEFVLLCNGLGEPFSVRFFRIRDDKYQLVAGFVGFR
ncbi:MAG: hypothetical protein WBA16_10480 [Nonlabens sp.]